MAPMATAALTPTIRRLRESIRPRQRIGAIRRWYGDRVQFSRWMAGLTSLPVVIGLTTLAATPAGATSVTPGSASVTIPYLASSGGSSGLVTVPLLPVSVNNGTAQNVVLDTGSVGLVLPPNYATPTGTAIASGSISYDNGKTYTGSWYTTAVGIGGGGATATATVPVFFADTITCNLQVNPNCDTTATTPVLGVGFARGDTVATPTAVEKNPLLHITSVNGVAVSPGAPGQAGDLTSGYVLTQSGITLGLTAANTAGFGFVTLTPIAGLSYVDWSAPGMTLTANGVSARGTVLTDSGWGVGSMLVEPLASMGVTASACGGSYCPASPGNSFTLAIGPEKAPVVSYSFAIGADGSVTTGAPPAAAIVAIKFDAADAPFVNTGTNFLNSYDYLYDYQDGLVGYRAVTEPAMAGLFGLGLLAAVAARRRLGVAADHPGADGNGRKSAPAGHS
jgi:hypothetical protein